MRTRRGRSPTRGSPRCWAPRACRWRAAPWRSTARSCDCRRRTCARRSTRLPGPGPPGAERGMKAKPEGGAGVAVLELVEAKGAALRLQVAAGRAGLASRVIRQARVQRPGLALTGYTDYIRYGRVQIVG